MPVDTCFSAGGLAIVSGLMAALAACITALFKLLQAAGSARIADKDLEIGKRDRDIDKLQAQLSEALELLKGGQEVNQRVLRHVEPH